MWVTEAMPPAKFLVVQQVFEHATMASIWKFQDLPLYGTSQNNFNKIIIFLSFRDAYHERRDKKLEKFQSIMEESES